MASIGTRQFLMFLVCLSMVVTGWLRLTGRLSSGPVLVAGVIVALVVVSFSVGRTSVGLW